MKKSLQIVNIYNSKCLHDVDEIKSNISCEMYNHFWSISNRIDFCLVRDRLFNGFESDLKMFNFKNLF